MPVLLWSSIHGRTCAKRERIHVLQSSWNRFEGLFVDRAHRIKRYCGFVGQSMAGVPLRGGIDIRPVCRHTVHFGGEK